MQIEYSYTDSNVYPKRFRWLDVRGLFFLGDSFEVVWDTLKRRPPSHVAFSAR